MIEIIVILVNLFGSPIFTEDRVQESKGCDYSSIELSDPCKTNKQDSNKTCSIFRAHHQLFKIPIISISNTSRI